MHNITPDKLALLDEKHRKTIEMITDDGRISTTIIKMLKTAFSEGQLVALGVKEIWKYLPFLGVAIAGSVAFAFALRFLLKTINDIEDVANALCRKVITKAIEGKSHRGTENPSTE